MNEETAAAIEAMQSLEGMEWLEDLEWIKGTYDWADVFSSDITNLLGVVDLVLNIFMLLAFIWMWYWIYTLAKKMWVKHAWMWWIPLFQYYTMCQVAGVKFFKHVVIPFLIIIGVVILIFIAWFTGVIWSNLMLFWIIAWTLYIAAYIFSIVRYIWILSPISKKTWRGWWSTAGLFFIPFIMFPVVAYKYKAWDNKTQEAVSEKIEEVKEEL